MPSRRFLIALAALPLYAQPDAADPQRWNLYLQATSIGQYHPSFTSPYQNSASLTSHAEAEASVTATLFFGWRLTQGTQLYFDPEIAGGRGFSGTLGVANFPNGEITRAATATPRLYLGRIYVTQDFGFGSERETVESDENQLAGSRPMTRYSITVGRFSATDFFDDNKYTHDPRTQFMGWGAMFNGAWDYPADSRGYTWGWMHEFHARHWSLRYGSMAEPRVANGLRFDRRLFRDRGDVVEGEARPKFGKYEGAYRLLGYVNHADAGTYADAIRESAHPDVTATRRIGTIKYGFGISLDQPISKSVGAFARLGWNDGKTESWAFTPIDRLATVGVSVTGARWGRAGDTVASAVTIVGISGVHAVYLSRGGFDFLIGDGGLRYAPETISETYYSARVREGFFATLDVQHINNPAYNRDRGPVWVGALRLHAEFGLKK